jgi:hypothetical protein
LILSTNAWYIDKFTDPSLASSRNVILRRNDRYWRATAPYLFWHHWTFGALPSYVGEAGRGQYGAKEMGHDKDSLLERDERWNALARKKDYRCSICMTPVPFEERKIYFDTGMCGYCAHKMEKIERE